MKILRFNDDRIGILKDHNRVVDVTDTVEAHKVKGPQRVIAEIISNFDTFRAEFERIATEDDGVPLADVTLLTPIPRPNHCLAAFANYLDRSGRTKDDLPNDFYYKDTNLLGPEGTIELVDIPPVLVYQTEAELAYVMGKTSKNVTEADAMDHVFGYMPFFDISARGMSRRTTFLSKGQATFGPCGPRITTKDEIEDPHDLVVRSWVNGEARQDYNTKHMARNIPEQIAWATRFAQLDPGDVVATGTYHVGLGPLNSGDVLEIEIQGLGRARYFAKGDSPRKDMDFTPGITQAPRPEGGVTKVV